MQRTSCLALSAMFASLPAAGAGFTGEWQIASSVNGNPVAIVCSLVQEGNVLRGACKPDGFEPSSLAGSVSGKKVIWGYDVVFNGKLGHVSYEAEVGADGRLSGTLYLAGNPTPFTAHKQ